ncbi:hypothetical protein BJ508DRAFT_366543 [Ascobolus immersus RN42]|uniref:Uncharacterized protein n=1 Tax=Ascobolus immersus RN42 TaxID=1160509 RepID=A0A3N4HIR5_ASCIM|nr:hypothetical protein BJ508DRAFT_366543 [Ascobolus immersus RN42]
MLRLRHGGKEQRVVIIESENPCRMSSSANATNSKATSIGTELRQRAPEALNQRSRVSHQRTLAHDHSHNALPGSRKLEPTKGGRILKRFADLVQGRLKLLQSSIEKDSELEGDGLAPSISRVNELYGHWIVEELLLLNKSIWLEMVLECELHGCLDSSSLSDQQLDAVEEELRSSESTAKNFQRFLLWIEEKWEHYLQVEDVEATGTVHPFTPEMKKRLDDLLQAFRFAFERLFEVQRRRVETLSRCQKRETKPATLAKDHEVLPMLLFFKGKVVTSHPNSLKAGNQWVLAEPVRKPTRGGTTITVVQEFAVGPYFYTSAFRKVYFPVYTRSQKGGNGVYQTGVSLVPSDIGGRLELAYEEFYWYSLAHDQLSAYDSDMKLLYGFFRDARLAKLLNFEEPLIEELDSRDLSGDGGPLSESRYKDVARYLAAMQHIEATLLQYKGKWEDGMNSRSSRPSPWADDSLKYAEWFYDAEIRRLKSMKQRVAGVSRFGNSIRYWEARNQWKSILIFTLRSDLTLLMHKHEASTVGSFE